MPSVVPVPSTKTVEGRVCSESTSPGRGNAHPMASVMPGGLRNACERLLSSKAPSISTFARRNGVGYVVCLGSKRDYAPMMLLSLQNDPDRLWPVI